MSEDVGPFLAGVAAFGIVAFLAMAVVIGARIARR